MESAASKQKPSTPQAEPLRVLVVDDDPILLKIIRATLEKGGLQVTLASSLKEARERLSTDSPFTAIVCDIHLGDEDGRELLPWMRKNKMTSPFFLMSGDHVVPENEYASLGSDGFLHKPFKVERLILKLVLTVGKEKSA